MICGSGGSKSRLAKAAGAGPAGMYTIIDTHTHIYIYTYISIHIYTYIYINVSLCFYIYIYINKSIFMCQGITCHV